VPRRQIELSATTPKILTLKSRSLKKQIQFAEANGINALRLNGVRGFARSDIEVLRSFPWITALEVALNGEFDWSPLLGLSKLEYLFVDHAPSVDLARLGALKIFHGQWHPAQNLGACTNLVSLALDRFGAGDLGHFRRCLRLEELTLVRPKIRSFVNLDNLNLFELRVSLRPREVSLAGVRGAPHLVEVEVSKCRAVSNLRELATLQDLYELRFNELRMPVRSLAKIMTSPRLQGLRFVGTRITARNFDKLEQLKWVGFNNAAHYSMTEQHLDAILRAKGGGAVVMTGDWHKHQADLRERRREVALRHGLSNWVHEHAHEYDFK
jgi:hypothetical protein